MLKNKVAHLSTLSLNGIGSKLFDRPSYFPHADENMTEYKEKFVGLLAPPYPSILGIIFGVKVKAAYF